MYQVDFLLPLKLEEILCHFGLWPQNNLGQSVCRIFYFWLVWLVKLNTGGPLLHCTCLHGYRHIGIYAFYVFIYIYIYIYIYICLCLYIYIGILFVVVCACSYLHIFTYSFGSYRGLIRMPFVFWSPLSLQYILVFLYMQRSI